MMMVKDNTTVQRNLCVVIGKPLGALPSISHMCVIRPNWAGLDKLTCC